VILDYNLDENNPMHLIPPVVLLMRMPYCVVNNAYIDVILLEGLGKGT